MHLPQREIMELQAQMWRDIGIRQLLVREHDIEADRRRAHFERAPVGCLHDRWTPPEQTTNWRLPSPSSTWLASCASLCRSAGLRVGKECVSKGRLRWSPYHYTKHTITQAVS